jgi:hypothetical protein
VKTCRVRQKALAKRLHARIHRLENTVHNMRALRTVIACSEIKSADIRVSAATLANTRNGEHSCYGVIRFARSRDFAAGLPNQLKPIIRFRFALAARDLTSQTDKAHAKLITLGRPPQKTPFFLDTKRWGQVNLYKSKALKPPSYLPTHRREIEKIVKSPLSPMESTIEPLTCKFPTT